MKHSHPLAEGIYELSRAIENPKPGRKRNDWRCVAEFPQGYRFCVEHMGVGRDETVLAIRLIGSRDSVTAHTHGPLFALLVAYLQPAHEKPSELLEREHWEHWALDVLDLLCEDGKFTTADVERLLRQLFADRDEKKPEEKAAAS